MKILRMLTLSVLMVTAATAVAQDVKTDYDHTTDFSKYKTYMWIKEPKTNDPLMHQRIVDAIDAQLEAKGLRRVTGSADIGVSANTATREKRTLENFYSGFPGWGWRRYWGPPITTTVDTYTVGTLVVDLFDSRTKQVKWWGSASDTVSDKPEKNAKKLNKAVEKMFKEFPPKAPDTD